MIDYKYQGKGYGKIALRKVIEEMKKLKECNEIYLSFSPKNEIGKRLYESFNFKNTGKTVVFSFFKECMAINPDIVCLNYLDYQKDIKEIVSKEKGKLIVIDNADILLSNDTRKYISLDDKNQYLIK